MAQMGERTFQEMVRAQPVVSDPRAKAYVACVTRALVEALPAEYAGGRWSVALFGDGTPNAFALPGGKIGVNAGMLRVARNQDQLAAVIGHEIAHVIANHGNERLTQELAVKGGLMLADLLVENPGSREHEVLRGALGLGAQYGLLLPYSRTHEREADLLGLDFMARAGFDPRESLNLWRNMARVGGGQPLEFLSTHPSNETRLEELAAGMDAAMATFRQARSQGRRPQCG
jgi:predicted Zn-dependent protease